MSYSGSSIKKILTLHLFLLKLAPKTYHLRKTIPSIQSISGSECFYRP